MAEQQFSSFENVLWFLQVVAKPVAKQQRSLVAARASAGKDGFSVAETPASVLRRILEQPGIHQAPACYDALSASLVEKAGFKFAFMSGKLGCTLIFCVARLFKWWSLSEVYRRLKKILMVSMSPQLRSDASILASSSTGSSIYSYLQCTKHNCSISHSTCDDHAQQTLRFRSWLDNLIFLT